MFQGRFRSVSRVFERSLKEFQGSFKKVSRVFQGRLKGVSREISVGLKGI